MPSQKLGSKSKNTIFFKIFCGAYNLHFTNKKIKQSESK